MDVSHDECIQIYRDIDIFVVCHYMYQPWNCYIHAINYYKCQERSLHT